MSRTEYLEDEYDQLSVNATMLLVIWLRASTEEGSAGGRLRLMKLAFLTARRMAEESICALSLSFYRWKFGPMSNEVYDTWERLRAAGLLEEEEVWSVTPSGMDFADAFYREVLCDEQNAAIREVVDEVSDKWRSAWSAQPLMAHTYDLSANVDGTGFSIRDMPLGAEFESPPMPPHTNFVLSVGNDWVETIALKLNPSTLPMLQAAVEDFRAGRILMA